MRKMQAHFIKIKLRYLKWGEGGRKITIFRQHLFHLREGGQNLENIHKMTKFKMTKFKMTNSKFNSNYKI